METLMYISQWNVLAWVDLIGASVQFTNENRSAPIDHFRDIM